MLLAGEDTTANTLAWMIWLLDRHPDVCRDVAEQVRAALGAQTQPASYEQLARLDFVDDCAHETLRLKPVAPLLPLQAARASTIGDIAVPKGALVICLLRPAGIDERRFADAMRFRPRRWQADGPAQSGSAKRVLMPFGGGPRICPGRYLALQEIRMVVAMLFGTFDLERVTTPDGTAAQERLALTMAPCALQLKLKPRDRIPSATAGH
jgi:cytochrome P450